MWFILAMGLSLLPTAASVFAVRHKKLPMLIHSVLTSLKTNQHEWQQLSSYPMNVFLSDHTQALSKNGQVVTLHWGFRAKEALFVWIILYAVSLSLPLTCSYLPAAGERLADRWQVFPSDTSTANCQTGFLGQTLINHSACWGIETWTCLIM